MKIKISLSTVKASPVSQLERTILNMVRSAWATRKSEYDGTMWAAEGKPTFKDWLLAKSSKWKMLSRQSTATAPQLLNVQVPWDAVQAFFGLLPTARSHTKALLVEHFKATATSLGWYMPNVQSDNECVSMFFRPLAYSPLLKVPAFVYHFTPIRNKKRILQKGLIPREGKHDTTFMYPPRVHLLSKFDIEYVRDLVDAVHHDETTSDQPIVVFQVDTSKLPAGTKLYHDPSVENGLWTYTHIPTTALLVIHEDQHENAL